MQILALLQEDSGLLDSGRSGPTAVGEAPRGATTTTSKKRRRRTCWLSIDTISFGIILSNRNISVSAAQLGSPRWPPNWRDRPFNQSQRGRPRRQQQTGTGAENRRPAVAAPDQGDVSAWASPAAKSCSLDCLRHFRFCSPLPLFVGRRGRLTYNNADYTQ